LILFSSREAAADMSQIGYAWIQDVLGAPDFLGTQHARIAPVSRIERLTDGSLLVPGKVAPEPDLLQHALFALKHEGVNLGLLIRLLQRVSPEALAQQIRAAPNSVYGRKLGYLWE